MRFRDKVRAGLNMLGAEKGVRNKLSMARKLALIAARSRLSRKAAAEAQTVDVKAEAWAEYFLLSFVNRPVNVRVDTALPPRLWLVVPELNASVIFGGYIAVFQFLHYLQNHGVKTNILVLRPIPDRAELLESFAGNKLVSGVLGQSHIEGLGAARTVRMGPGDAVLAYDWTTSQVASKLAKSLETRAYYYFVQEDERIFYSNDSTRFLAESVFHQSPRPRLICNSARLLEHFVNQGLVEPDAEVAVFEQGLPAAPLPSAQEMAERHPRKFVFYGRPEAHAKRNLMTIALMAISRAVKDRVFDKEPWEFYMLGSSRMGETFDLDGVKVHALPNMDYDSYRRQMTDFDVGMGLMYAPHPSVPPFEMVRSGIITVVNTTRARTAEWYRSVSGNFEPAEPTVQGLADAIGRAVARVDDVDARLARADTYHPGSWDESFANILPELSHPIFRAAEKG
ncbi:hypothetical protein [Paracoccus pacificus]|uniref:Uncharacterized protein n=1 Tax=Paracoccus pacificus TaxID=1463598 RepID=A0ABW4R6Q6_9RHOB